MSFDENELRRALEARSGEVSPEYRARLGRAVAGAPPAGGSSWMAAIAVVVVTVLAATSVGVLLAARNARHLGPIASGPRVATPTPTGKIPAGPNVFVSAPSRDAVWLLIDYTHLYLSTDRGDHWVSRPLPPDLGIKPSISFIDASEGWLLAPGSPTTECQEAHAEIWHTTDAGTSWHQLAAAGLADAQCKEAIYFPDAKHGFVSAWDDLHQPSVYATSDGGLSWRKSTLPDGPLFTTQPGGFTLRIGWIKRFGNTVYLEASGMQDDGSWPRRDFIFTSGDGGATWSWKQKIGSGYTFMVTESRWLQLAPDVEETVNGGQQFHPYESDFHGVTAPDAVFADSQLAYAADGGALQRSLDGGAHWTLIKTPGT